MDGRNVGLALACVCILCLALTSYDVQKAKLLMNERVADSNSDSLNSGGANLILYPIFTGSVTDLLNKTEVSLKKTE